MQEEEYINLKNKMFILKREYTAVKEFIEFWSNRYSYNERIKYEELIENKNFELVLKWKNGLKRDTKLSAKNQEIVKKLRELNKDLKLFEENKIELKEIYELLEKVTKGRVYRILFLNIIKPDEYPIIDQHTFRAFNYLFYGNHKDKVENLEEYENFRKFVLELQKETKFRLRVIDKALMAFGQFLKKERFKMLRGVEK